MPETIEIFQCGDCGARFSHDAPVCPSCLGERIETRKIGGAGVLEAWTVIRKPAPAFAGNGPFVVGVARLQDGGALVSGRLDGDPDGLDIGAPVTAGRDGDGRVVLRPSSG